jgi:hypothetical protein
VLGEEPLSFLEDRVQSGPQESSARRVLARRSGRLTPRTDLERSGQEGKGFHSAPIHPLRSLNSLHLLGLEGFEDNISKGAMGALAV